MREDSNQNLEEEIFSLESSEVFFLLQDAGARQWSMQGEPGPKFGL
jgi:hypothetical protein